MMSQLSHLRAKTDRQLLNLIGSQLKVNVVALAKVDRSIADRVSVAHVLKRADEALNEVQTLMCVVSEEQKRELYPKVKQLREALDRFGRPGESRMCRSASMS